MVANWPSSCEELQKLLLSAFYFICNSIDYLRLGFRKENRLRDLLLASI